MASKNALPARSGAGGKNTTVSKAVAPQQKRTRRNMSRGEILVQQDHRMRRIGSVILFAVGVLFICLTLIQGESLWNILHNALFALFSWGAFFIGPLLILYSILGVSDKAAIILSNKVWQTLILVLLISVTIEVFHPDTALQFANEEAMAAMTPEDYAKSVELHNLGAIDQVIQLANDGMILEGGGLISALIAWPLILLFGSSGTKIIVVLLLFVFAMLMTGLTVADLFRAFTKPVRKASDRYKEARDKRKTQTADEIPVAPVRTPVSARSRRVDIPIESDPELPQHPVRASTPVEDSDNGLFRRSTAKSGGDRVHSARERLFGQKKVPIDLPTETSSPVSAPTPAFAPAPRPRVNAVDIDLGDGQPSGPQSLEPEDTRYIIQPAQHTDDEIHPLQESLFPETTEAILRDAPVPEPAEEPFHDEVSEPASPLSDADSTFEGLISNVTQTQTAAPSQSYVIPQQSEPTDGSNYKIPSTGLLQRSEQVNEDDVTEELRSNASLLVDTLASFGVQTRIVDISRGPSVTRYELQPSAGVKISRITSLADDISLNLAAAGVRIEAPIPNKAAVGIEVPNKIVSTVHISEIVENAAFQNSKSRLTVALGKDIEGQVVTADIAKMPHLLIAGATGSGKSVCINSFIISLLYKATPDDVRLLLVDPKVVELGVYNGIPHLLIPVVTDPRKAAGALAWAVNEMLNRYKLFADNAVRDLSGYNNLARSRTELGLQPMPQIVIVIDELADLMMAAPNDVESSICRLAQMARAAGMHLIIATQRPSVDVITGIIKANIPSRIAFGVSSQVDSRTILDGAGAEKLLGKGDMLFFPVGASKPRRVQGCFVSDSEVERVVNFIKNQGTVDYDQQVIDDIERQAVAEKSAVNPADEGVAENDELLRDAVEIVVDAGQASTSLLQRKLKVGYARAGRLIDEMEQRGIVGPFEGSKPRTVLITHQQLMEMDLQ